MYYSHYMIIKYINFKPIYHVINLNTISFFIVLKNLFMCFIEYAIRLNQ